MKFVLSHAEARRRAALAVAQAADGWVITIKPPKRDSGINAALHAKLGEIADSREWAGRRWPIEVWKRLLVAAWSRAASEAPLILPALDGLGVDIVWRRTAEMTQDEMRDLLGFIEAWQAETEAQA